MPISSRDGDIWKQSEQVKVFYFKNIESILRKNEGKNRTKNKY